MVPGAWGRLDPPADISDDEIEKRAHALLQRMSPAEKLRQMSGDIPAVIGLIEMARSYNSRPLPAGENFRLGIPGIRFSDGPRGAVIHRSTCFPVAMARGASWDVDLERRVGDAIGTEIRAGGGNFFGGVCVNLLRHPGWGRAQETYGEDPHHLGEMGAAVIDGSQRHVMACVKHFAANSIENSRFRVDVRMDDRTLYEVYLPHFKRCVDAGVASVMSAYNRLDGAYCGHNRRLLREILKGEWGFRGFVISDFIFGVRSADAVSAGMDVEMPFTIRFGRNLARAVRRGLVAESDVDDSVLRLLRQKLRFAARTNPHTPSTDQAGHEDREGARARETRYSVERVAGPEHRALARESAVKSIVLLKNDPPRATTSPALPIARSGLRRLAVIGPLVDRRPTGDRGSSHVRPPHVVSPLEGLRAAVGDGVIVDYDDGMDTRRAADIAGEADAAILAVGYTHRDEGERIDLGYKRFGGDRTRLELPRAHESLIAAVVGVQPKTVVAMYGGSAIITERWRQRVPAIVMAWYPGMEGGHALADIIFGDANPSAKLPVSFPRALVDLPPFDPKARQVRYDYFHGYRLLDRRGIEPAFPFGFGLSYTTFSFADLRLDRESVDANGALTVHVDVTNTGARRGAEVVQLYLGCPDSAVVRAKRVLKGFAKVELDPGETRTVTLPLAACAAAYYDDERHEWIVEPGRHEVWVGPSSRESDLLTAAFEIEPAGQPD